MSHAQIFVKFLHCYWPQIRLYFFLSICKGIYLYFIYNIYTFLFLNGTSSLKKQAICYKNVTEFMQEKQTFYLDWKEITKAF